MKRLITAAAISAAFLALPLTAGAATPPYSNGPVWEIVQIQTKDGRLRDYLQWVDTVWKAQEEMAIKAGYIIGYKVYQVVDPRQGEPNLLLCAEYKNMAALDTPVSKVYALLGKQVGGTAGKFDQEEVARTSIRTVQGDMLLRELDLK